MKWYVFKVETYAWKLNEKGFLIFFFKLQHSTSYRNFLDVFAVSSRPSCKKLTDLEFDLYKTKNMFHNFFTDLEFDLYKTKNVFQLPVAFFMKRKDIIKQKQARLCHLCMNKAVPDKNLKWEWLLAI